MENKVLFTASTYSHIRNFHLPYLCAFQEQGWVVHVACGGKARPIPFADETVHLPFEKQMTSPANFRAAMLLRERIRRERYTLLITHTSLAAFFTRLALVGLKNRPRVVNMVHGYLFDDDTNPVKKQLLLTAERVTAPYTDLLLTMNQWDFEPAKRCHLGARVVNVPGIGVDFSRLRTVDEEQCWAARRALGIPDGGVALLYAAEFSRRKSQSVLIRAMEQLPGSVFLILAGEGALLEECRELARSLGVADRVIFPGYVEDVGLWYGMADAAVSASRSEGLPFNIMEAMYAGLPVIASAVKGHEDLILDGETGLLYPYGDPDACARAVLRLLDTPALGEKLAAQAREKVLPYQLERVLPMVMEQYGVPVVPASVCSRIR